LWDDYTKQQVDLKDADDGCFWISFKDYEKFFYITTVCFYNPEMIQQSISDELLDDFGIVRLSVGLQQKAAITLDQVSARFVDDTMRGDYQYAALRLMLIQIVDGD
jgi:hypothetical protein